VGRHQAERLSQVDDKAASEGFMASFVIRRTLYAVVTLLILSLTIFTVVRLTGDPVTLMAEPGARAEDLDRIRAEWGLDRPLPVQYLSFLKNIATGELGNSFNYEMPVSTLYFQRLPNSLELAFAATLISFVIGIPLGLISAVKVNTWWDSAGKIIALFGLAVPGFWLGLVMILIFSVWLGWLPTSGQGGLQHLIMPAVALGWYFAASLLRLTRSSMLEVMRSEYIKLARLKGLPGHVVIAMHAFKNALIPVLTLAGVNLVVMINAAVIIEVIFAWPGIGRLLYEGIFQRDFPLVQGVVMEAGIMIVLINLTIDILYAYIDPRIRLTR
jgi:ABC-type dipeptide/oligopeptide/nickel transport system permease component